MEESENQSSQESPVSFPTVGEQKKSSKGKIFLIFGILVLIGILGYVIFKNSSKSSDTTNNSDIITFDNPTTPDTISQQTPVPTATTAAVDKTKVQIEVQNGTGIPGEAAYLQTQLASLGYTNVQVANATSQNAVTTEVTFSSSLSQSVVSEITQKLNTIYQTVKVSTSATATKDVVIVTGVRKGATARPSASPSASPRASASPSASPTPTP